MPSTAPCAVRTAPRGLILTAQGAVTRGTTGGDPRGESGLAGGRGRVTAGDARAATAAAGATAATATTGGRRFAGRDRNLPGGPVAEHARDQQQRQRTSETDHRKHQCHGRAGR